ncbi:type II toxin-antitoxin system CcdA family antitoxin [Marinoscillum sp.]|uniref:type II toxin-antitoxin system CcdA family antitoxin n=1 Tax=Marinoscillum sp. TaxID=2024838 RepID=UPI003BAC8921
MQLTSNSSSGKRKSINLTIHESVLEEAKSLKLNMSQEAEKGIIRAIRKGQEEQWRDNNKAAIQSYNQEIETRGLLLKPAWMSED